MSLKPPAIAAVNYGIAQTPTVGGEIEAYASLTSAGVRVQKRNVDGATYEEFTYYDATKANCVAAVVVGPVGLTGEVAGIIEVPGWSVNKTEVFPSGKAGVGSMPATFGEPGEMLYEVDIPDVTMTGDDRNWWPVGCTTEKRIKMPTRVSKNIACGMESAKYVVPGRAEIGELSITSYNQGHEEGLLKIAGLKASVMLRVLREGRIEVARIFILDWIPSVERTDPEGEGESTVTASGMFSRCAIITADGETGS